MECRPNDQIHSFNHTEHSEGNFAGLTKREHMAIEFTKALLSREIYTRNELMQGGVCDIAQAALVQADELIKQLKQTQK